MLDGAQRSRSAKLRGDALTGLAFLAARRLDYAKADEYYARARAMRKASGDQLALARQDAIEGVLAMEQGHSHIALAHVRAANAAFGLLGMRQEQAMTLFDMSQACADQGELSAQRAMLEAAAAIYSDVGDEYGALRVKVAMSYADLLSHRISEGVTNLEGATADAQRLNYPTLAAEWLTVHGQLLALQAKWSAAEVALRQSMALYHSVHAEDGARDARWEHAEVLAHQGRIDEALDEVQVAPDGLATPSTRAYQALHRGNVLATVGKMDDAMVEWRTAYGIAADAGIDPLQTTAAVALASALIVRGSLSEAEPLIGKVQSSGNQGPDVQALQAAYAAATDDKTIRGHVSNSEK